MLVQKPFLKLFFDLSLIIWGFGFGGSQAKVPFRIHKLGEEAALLQPAVVPTHSGRLLHSCRDCSVLFRLPSRCLRRYGRWKSVEAA
eukprot:456059-Amphidinium_carterae.1